MCGGKGGQTGTSNQATQTTIPPEVLARYNQVYARGEQAANQPFQSYTGQFVAPVTDTQRAGVEQIGAAGGVYQPFLGQAVGTLTPNLQGAASSFNNASGAASPYNMGAAGLIGGSVGASSPLTDQQIGQYMNPYTQNVVNATTGWLNQQNQQQQNALSSDAIMSGAFGGDRSGIAKGVLSGQQNLANASTIAGLYNQNYAQGLAAAQQQQGQRVGALQQGAQLTAGLGNQVFGQNIQTGQNLQNLGTQGAQAYSGLGQQAFQNQLGYGQALMGAGTLEQQTQQADLSARYNQFLQQQAYPFQSTQFLSNLATGTGALSGSGSQSYAYQPQPFFSDDRLKENVHDIGKTKDGLRIVRYNFKGDDKLRIGFLASDVEDKMPEAVTKHHGVRAVDYERAARAGGGGLRSFEDLQKQSDENGNDLWSQISPLPEPKDAMEWISPAVRIARLVGLAEGGAVSGLMPREGYAQGGYDPNAFASMLQLHQAMYPGAGGREGVGGESGPRGMKLSQSRPQMLKAEQPKLAPPPESSMQSTARGLNDIAGLGKNAADLYSTGKDALVGTAAKGNTPATGGLVGTGGKWDYNQGWLGRNTGSGTSGGIAAPGASGQTGSITSTPLPEVSQAPADTTTAGIAAPAPADLAGNASDVAGLVPEATEAATETASYMPELLDSLSFFARRGGRAARAPGGGIEGDIPYDTKGSTGYFPDDLDEPTDPTKLLAEQKALAPPPAQQQKSGSSGSSDAAGILGGLGSLAKLGMMFIKRGGRVDDDVLSKARRAIGTIESSNRYDVVGPATGGDRPYGRYQVMGKNIGPWTREALGRELTAEQFLADREAQDTVFNHHFGKALHQYGTPEDAASVWFSGRPMRQAGNDRDVLGTSVPDYVKRFQSALGDGSDYTASPVVGERSAGVVSASGDEEPQPDIHTTARVLNELGLASGGRAGYEEGGGTDERGDRLVAQMAMPAMAAGIVPPSDRGIILPPPDEPPPVSSRDLLQPAANVQANTPPRPPVPAPGPAATPAPAPGLALPAAAPTAAPASQLPAPVDQAAGLVPAQQPDEKPGFFDRRGWLDRNERPVMTALSFLGNMLGSPSRTLAGSIGHGLQGAAQTWPGMGFKQQALDIEQQQANTQQIDKMQNAINLVAAQKARLQQLNPTAGTATYDASLKALMGRLGTLLQAPGMGNTLQGGDFGSYLSTLPKDTQSIVGNLNTVDNPWLYEYLANSPGIPESTRNEYLRQRDAAIERVRMGQARDKSGLQVVPAENLTSAAMALKTQQVAAVGAGEQMTPQGRIQQAQTEISSILKQAGVAGPDDLPPELRAKYNDALRRINENRAAIGASSNPGVAPRRYGGRTGFDTGGAPGGLVPSDEPQPDIQLAQATPPPPSATDQNDPEFWRKRASALGAAGLTGEADAAYNRAQQIMQERRSSGTLSTPQGETAPVPGSIETRQRQQAGQVMVEQNAKLTDELFQRAQTGNQALQLAKELRSTMFDENDKPTSSMGPFNEVMNRAGATFQQLGVPQNVLNSLRINPADKQAAEKVQASIAAAIARGDLGPNVRQNEFFHFMNSATPNMGMMPAAAKFIIDNVLIPRAQLEVDAFNSIKDLPPTENRQNRFYDWQLQNPWYKGARIPQEKSQATPAAPGAMHPSLSGIKNYQTHPQHPNLIRDKDTGAVYDRETGKKVQ